jgi:hypothetical protein
MTASLFILLLVAAVLAVYAGIAFATWFRMRGTRVVECPETHRPAAVHVDRLNAALSAISESGSIQLNGCSRWSERGRCDEACAAQIAAAPHDTLATALLQRFFDDKLCTVCHRPIHHVHAGDEKPGLLDPKTGAIIAWEAIWPQAIPSLTETHLPICSNCQVIESFRRKYPDLVVDRHRTVRNPWS